MNRIKHGEGKIKASRVKPGAAPQPRQDSPSPPQPRTIFLKRTDRIVTTTQGIPDHLTTRWICFTAGAIGTAIGGELLIALFSQPLPNDAGPAAGVLLGFLAFAMTAMSVLLIREGFRTGAWFTVGSAGIHYGNGRLDPQKNMGTQIEWQEIVRNPETSCDITIRHEGTYGNLKVPGIKFWRCTQQGKLVERTIPLWLTENMLKCFRFGNAQEVRIALLQGLAGCPGLRFHPDVFVEAGVDPQTWKSMRRPEIVDWSILMFALAIWFAFALTMLDTLPFIALFASFLAILGIAVLISTRFHRVAYPGFTDSICFCPEHEPEMTEDHPVQPEQKSEGQY